MNIPILPKAALHRRATGHPFPLLFATISGAHLYGFPSPDSDFDLRGAHILPPREMLGLAVKHETIEISSDPATDPDHLEFDIVSHDVKKFFSLLLKKNGYVLEQLYSPLVVLTSPEHEELMAIAKDCITKHHSYHYLGFAATEWKLFAKESPRRVKPLLYVYRVLLTGIHLMQTGRIEANLQILNEQCALPYVPDLIARKLAGNEQCALPYVPDLIARKLAGPEQAALPDADFAFHESEFHRLEELLKQAQETSALPESSTAAPALNDLLLRLRLCSETSGSIRDCL